MTLHNRGVTIVGHRGLGANVPKYHRLQLGENTLLSFLKAHEAGADAVEFDVQVTRDGVPVLYHDFFMAECSVPIPLHLVTYQRFQALASWRRRGTTQDDLLLEKEGNADGVRKNGMGTVMAPFCTLQEALCKLPEALAFNIELKYPRPDECADWPTPPMPMERYLGAILPIVETFASNRRIFFSSFHPDLCSLARKSQEVHPVWFLTDAGLVKTPDSRCNSLQASAQHAYESGLQELRQVREAYNLLIATYGAENNDLGHVVTQTSAGVSVIICDDVYKIVRGVARATSMVN